MPTNVTFDDESRNGPGGTVDDFATFNDNSKNVDGSVGASGLGYATFNDGSMSEMDTNGPVVGDNATFNDFSLCRSGVVGDYATFNDSAYQETGELGDYATFNSTGTFAGLYTGASYYLALTTNFDATCYFITSASLVFYITTQRGSLVMTGSNPITSDGGTTPVGYSVSIDTQADLAEANIKLGKTILGVAGTLNIAGAVAAQLATDKAAVVADKANILKDHAVPGFGITGADRGNVGVA